MRRKSDDILKEKKNFQLRILYLAMLFFRNDRDKDFPKQRVMDFITTILALQDMSEGDFSWNERILINIMKT